MLDPARYRGALLGVLVGDVLGAPFEGHSGVVPGADIALVQGGASVLGYTDDTAMTVAFAESLIRTGGVDEDDLAAAFAHEWSLCPERGYSSRTAALLSALWSGTTWRQALAAQAAGAARASNGASMRVVPAALAAGGRIGGAVELARRSALVTHTHPGAVAGACVVAAAVAWALRHPAGDPVDPAHLVAALRAVSDDIVLDVRLEEAAMLWEGGDAAEIAARLGTGILASEAVPAAVCAFLSHPYSFPEAITLAVSLGGDTDTIAAMTGGIAGALLGESAIPTEWVARAEAAARVRRLADGLFSLADQRPAGE